MHRVQCIHKLNRINGKGSSETPLKRVYNFKGLSVRHSIGYPMVQEFMSDSFHHSLSDSGGESSSADPDSTDSVTGVS